MTGYWNSIELIAQEIKDDLPNPDGDREARIERINQDVDGSGWIIYDANHDTVINETKNIQDERNVRAFSGETEWRKMRQAEAYLSMVADVQEKLQKLDDESPYVPQPFDVGDRIRLIEMERRRTGKTLPPGEEGEVTGLERDGQTWKIKVKWDGGSKLILSIPPDEVELA